jgi:DNA-binding MarR family transcriptional regulator
MTSPKRLAARLMDVMPTLGGALARAVRTSHTAPDVNSLVQLRTMHMLAARPLTFKQLCTGRGVAAPTLSRSINAMVRRGWIARTPDPLDKRKLLLALTVKGRKHLQNAAGATQRALANQLKSLNASERTRIIDALDLLASALKPPHV